MTMVDDARGTDDVRVDATLAEDLVDLRRALLEHPFPASQDDLIAACIGRHEPTRLACRLSKLPRERRYETLDEVLADVATAATQPVPR
ncbi:DUF2795 domain-containing protein [Nostocoides sp. Soil756]|jgi:hypothetical protein|uniref:DUF2795 domain-containing protein n=1 Tax=Nostocoides sp. Soil756 TaxID=1736399 RepID=UPI0006FC5CAC|nr:DUF2795 domain-containing protein [Tetrasphaera sp. Soil756]KRE63473.1 hypothetical protein ASG78_00765 [Tetrasphaera sp. Soil756]